MINRLDRSEPKTAGGAMGDPDARSPLLDRRSSGRAFLETQRSETSFHLVAESSAETIAVKDRHYGECFITDVTVMTVMTRKVSALQEIAK